MRDCAQIFLLEFIDAGEREKERLAILIRGDRSADAGTAW